MSEEANSVSFVPVIVGGTEEPIVWRELSMKRTKLKTNLISPMIIGPIGNSRIIKHYIQPGIDDLDLLKPSIKSVGTIRI